MSENSINVSEIEAYKNEISIDFADFTEDINKALSKHDSSAGSHAVLLASILDSIEESASKVSSQTDAKLTLKIDGSDITVTKQGNAFNGVNQLVQLNASGQLPALDASHLTNVTANSLNVNCDLPLKNTSGLVSLEFDNSLVLSDNKLSVVSDKIIKSDGSVSFTAEQSGITPATSTGLTTKSYVDSAVNGMIKSDGSVAFSGEQKGVDPTSSNGLTTKAFVQSLISAIDFSALATKTLSNITSVGKSVITSLPMPDYLNGINKSFMTTYQAECDGWVKFLFQSLNVWNFLQFSSDNITWIDVGETVCNTNSINLFIVPIQKGWYYRTTNSSAYAQSLVFFPAKGAN